MSETAEQPQQPVQAEPEPAQAQPVQAGEPVTIEPAEAAAPEPVAPAVPADGPAEATPVLSQSASNESPVLPPTAQAAAAKAHAVLTHLEKVIAEAKADLARYVPAGMAGAARTEVAALVRNLL